MTHPARSTGEPANLAPHDSAASRDEEPRASPIAPQAHPSVETRSTNLLPALTSFVGREQEMAEVRRLLVRESSGCRLLTLTGAGGSGKTRLAMEVAAGRLDAYTDGVWIV